MAWSDPGRVARPMGQLGSSLGKPGKGRGKAGYPAKGKGKGKGQKHHSPSGGGAGVKGAGWSCSACGFCNYETRTQRWKCKGNGKSPTPSGSLSGSPSDPEATLRKQIEHFRDQPTVRKPLEEALQQLREKKLMELPLRHQRGYLVGQVKAISIKIDKQSALIADAEHKRRELKDEKAALCEKLSELPEETLPAPSPAGEPDELQRAGAVLQELANKVYREAADFLSRSTGQPGEKAATPNAEHLVGQGQPRLQLHPAETPREGEEARERPT